MAGWRDWTLWLLLASVVIIALAAVLPWWEASTPGGPYDSSSYYLTYRMAYESTTTFGPLPYSAPMFSQMPSLRTIFGWTNTLVDVALGLSVLTLGIHLLSIWRPRLKLVGVPLGVVGSVIMIAAPLYLSVSLPGVVTLGLGSTAGPPYPAVLVTTFFGAAQNATWGAGPGWYLAFAGSVSLAIAALGAYWGPQRL